MGPACVINLGFNYCMPVDISQCKDY